MNKSIIFLTGFMGSGKSTLGPILANTLGWDFYDLDKEIESSTGLKVKEIFAKEGERYFREIELETLHKIIPGKKKVVALGGGTVTFEETLDLLKKIGILVYLKVTPEEAVKRLRYKRDRPVLLSGLKEDFTDEELLEKIRDLLQQRKNYYERSDIIFETDEMAIGKAVDLLLKEIFKDVR